MNRTSVAPIPNVDRRAPAGRRFVSDRRKSLTPINLRHLGLKGRRQQYRRTGDAVGRYVDWYSPKLMFLALTILICSCLDAFLTLNLLQLGAVELNLLMARLIETDIQTFVNAKIGLTGLCVTLLVIHKNFRVFRGITVEHMLLIVLAGYISLVAYEVRLLFGLLL
ncbi:MAG: hypothetical protein KJO66_04815 [Gammaproteobacteria bacterium]|nr:hypothetical protein [Gammaproteobacteria bacterium]